MTELDLWIDGVGCRVRTPLDSVDLPEGTILNLGGADLILDKPNEVQLVWAYDAVRLNPSAFPHELFIALKTQFANVVPYHGGLGWLCFESVALNVASLTTCGVVGVDGEMGEPRFWANLASGRSINVRLEYPRALMTALAQVDCLRRFEATDTRPETFLNVATFPKLDFINRSGRVLMVHTIADDDAWFESEAFDHLAKSIPGLHGLHEVGDCLVRHDYSWYLTRDRFDERQWTEHVGVTVETGNGYPCPQVYVRQWRAESVPYLDNYLAQSERWVEVDGKWFNPVRATSAHCRDGNLSLLRNGDTSRFEWPTISAVEHPLGRQLLGAFL